MQVGVVQQGLAGFRAALAQNEREVCAGEFPDSRCHIGYGENGGMGRDDLLKGMSYLRVT